MRGLRSLAVGLGLCLSAFCHGYSFSAADSLFEQRGHGDSDTEKLASATKAYESYKSLLSDSSLSAADKTYVVTQMSRLDIYRGNMLSSVDKSDRKDFLDSCIENISEISETNSQEYHYFYLACIASRGKLSGMIGRVKYGLKLKRAETAALESTKKDGELVGGFEAGGVLRIMSAVRSNRKAKPLGLYDADEAVRFAKLALDAPAQEFRPFEGSFKGEDFVENHAYLGQAQVAQGIENDNYSQVEEGHKTFESALSKIESGDFTDQRQYERSYYKAMMEKQKEYIESCKGDYWKSCLVEKLED